MALEDAQRFSLERRSQPAPAAPAPEPQDPTFGDYAGVGFRALAAIPRNVVAGTIGAVQGQSGVEAPGQGDVFEEYKRGVDAQNLAEQQAVAKQFPESTGIQTLSRLPQQVEFSAPATVAGIVTGVAAAPSAAVTGGAGPFIAGGLGASVPAYRASANQIMTSYIDTLDEQKRDKSGIGLTPEETEAAKSDFEAKATEYGLWEAIPEAIGSAVGGRLVFGPLKSLFGRKVTSGMLKKLGAVGATAAEELATETVTQIGQNKTLQGTSLADPEQLDWTPEDAATALGQVAPDTLLMTAFTGGLIKGGQVVGRRRQESNLAKKLGVDRATLRTRIQEFAAHKAANPDENISTEEMYSFLAGSVTVDGQKVTPPVAPEQAPVAEPPAQEPPVNVAPVVETPAVPAAEAPVAPTDAPVQEPVAAPAGDQAIQDQVFAGLQARREAEAAPAPEVTAAPAPAPTVEEVAAKIMQGETEFTPEELQLQQDEPAAVDSAVQEAVARRTPAQAPVQEAVAPEALQLIFNASGKPFSTETSARRSKTGKALAETHDVVQVEGGVAFAPKPETQTQEAQVTPAQAAEQPVTQTQEAQVDLSPVQEESGQVQTQVSDVRVDETGDAGPVSPELAAARQEEERIYAEKPKPLPKARKGDVAAISAHDAKVKAWRAKYKTAIDAVSALESQVTTAPKTEAPEVQGEVPAPKTEAPKTQDLPKLKRGSTRSIFMIDTPSFAGNTFIEDVSRGGKTTLMVQGRDGVIKPASKFISDQVEKAKRVPVEGVEMSEPVETSPVDVLVKDIEKKTGRVLKAGTITEAKAPKGREQAFADLGKLLKKKIVFFKATNSPFAIHGATDIQAGTIFVNVDSVKPHMTTVGHEFLHNLRREAPGMYTALKIAVMDVVSAKERMDMWAAINNKRAREGAQAMSLDKIDEELVANFFGEQFGKRSFWKALEAQNPEGFAAIVQKLIDFLEKVKSAFTGVERLDIQRAQDLAVKALAQYVASNPEVQGTKTEIEYSEMVDSTAKKNTALYKSKAFLKNLTPPLFKKTLLVRPMSSIVEAHKTDMPGLIKLESYQRLMTNVSSEISTIFGSIAEKINVKGTLEKITAVAESNTTRQMAGQKRLIEQDWVAAGKRAAKAVQVAKTQAELIKKYGETGKIGTVTPTDAAHAEKVATGAAKAMWTREFGDASTEQQLEWAREAWNKTDLPTIFGETFDQAYAKARADYTALSTEEKATYLSAVDQLRTVRIRLKNGLQAVIEETMAGDSVKMEEMVDRLNANFAQLKGNYWPLSRFGEYTLEFTDKRGQRNAESFESTFGRHRRMAELATEGIDTKTFQTGHSTSNYGGSAKGKDKLSAELVAALEKKEMANVDPNDEEAVNMVKEHVAQMAATINEAWIRLLPETSPNKNYAQRKTTLGWSSDMVRSFLTYGQHHGRKVAQLEVGRKIDKTISEMSNLIKERTKSGIDTTLETMVLNDQRARNNAAGSEGIGSGLVRGTGRYTVFHYMTSPSVFLVQMGQVAVFTLPKMMSKYTGKGGLSSRSVSASLTSGINKAFSQKYRRKEVTADKQVMAIHEKMNALITPEIRKARKNPSLVLGEHLYTDAQIDAEIKKAGLTKYQQELLALAAAGSMNLLDVSTAHEVNDWSQGKDPNSPQNRVFNGMMFFMRESEKASRKASILATFDASLKQGKSFTEARGDVKEVVDSSLFNPAFDAKGVAFRGDTMRVLMQLQTFRIITAFKMIGLFQQTKRRMMEGLTGKESSEVDKQATKEFIGIMGMSGVVAGTSGMLAMPIIFKLLNGLLGSDDEPYDAEKEWKQWLAENFGETTAEVATGGAFSLLGASLSRRVGLGDIYGFGTDAPAHLHGKGAADWWLTQMAGPTYSIGSSWVDAYDQIANEGEVTKGLIKALPKPFRDALKAAQLAADGLKAGDKRLLAAEDITVNEIFLTALGIQPLRTSNLTTREYKIKALGTTLSARFGQLVQDYVKAEGDRTEERAAIRAFTSKHPGYIKNVGGRVRSALSSAHKSEMGFDSRQFRMAEREFNK